MADQKDNRHPNKHDIDSLNEASLELGKAWGLAETLCFQASESPGRIDCQGVTRVICTLITEAETRVRDAEVRLHISDALAVCDLVLADLEEDGHQPNPASTWALESMPFVIQRAKKAVDSAPLYRQLKVA